MKQNWRNIKKILEDHDLEWPGTTKEQFRNKTEYYNEFEYYTPLGEDFVFTIWHNNTPKKFIEEFAKYADDFDPDNHSAMWIEARIHGNMNGIPTSNRELIDNADHIKEKLQTIANELKKLK